MVFWTVCTPNYSAMRHLECVFQMTVQRCFPVTHLAIHCSKITVWMPWLFNCDLEACDLTTSAYISYAPHNYVQKHRKCELHACLIGRVPRHSFPALGMLNPKFGLSCVHCVIQILQNFTCTSLVCTLHNSKMRNTNDNSNYALCSRVKTVIDSLYLTALGRICGQLLLPITCGHTASAYECTQLIGGSACGLT